MVVENDNPKYTASGPVTTDPESYYYLDAVVGSNNTGELSAIMEAALFILGQQNIPLEVEFVYDSQWAANVITGKSRPKRNRAMVYTAKRIFESLSCKTQVRWRWTKGHAGNAYNERADEVAAVGKSTGLYEGGRSQQQPAVTPHTLSRNSFSHCKQIRTLLTNA